jgi:hypothetical protein
VFATQLILAIQDYISSFLNSRVIHYNKFYILVIEADSQLPIMVDFM